MIFGYPYLEKQNMAGRQTQIGRSMISLWSNTLIEDIQANHGWLLKSISMKLITFILGWWSFLSWRIYNQWVDILGIYNYIYIIYIHMYVYTQCYSFHMDLNASWERGMYHPKTKAHILHHKVLESIGLMMGLHPHCSHMVVGGVFFLLSSPFSYWY